MALGAQARAHQSGNSESDIEVRADGRAKVRVAIAARELSTLAPVDRDSDGRIEREELMDAKQHLEKLALGLIELSADHKVCLPILEQIVLGDQDDGVDFFLEMRCEAVPRAMEAQVLMLGAFPPTHRHGLTLRAGDVVERAVLGGPARRATLQTPFQSRTRRTLWLAVAAALLVLCALGLRGRRSD